MNPGLGFGSAPGDSAGCAGTELDLDSASDPARSTEKEVSVRGGGVESVSLRVCLWAGEEGRAEGGATMAGKAAVRWTDAGGGRRRMRVCGDVETETGSLTAPAGESVPELWTRLSDQILSHTYTHTLDILTRSGLFSPSSSPSVLCPPCSSKRVFGAQVFRPSGLTASFSQETETEKRKN